MGARILQNCGSAKTSSFRNAGNAGRRRALSCLKKCSTSLKIQISRSSDPINRPRARPRGERPAAGAEMHPVAEESSAVWSGATALSPAATGARFAESNPTAPFVSKVNVCVSLAACFFDAPRGNSHLWHMHDHWISCRSSQVSLLRQVVPTVWSTIRTGLCIRRRWSRTAASPDASAAATLCVLRCSAA